ncbi:MAG: histidine phosphatase family protein [Alphaproteobacteria bacterium]|nr:histidine phosphatase family protein [Alphaproteobacteria bacterium]
MKTLYIIRHAHAEPRGTSLSDFDRPLDERGREESSLVADYISQKGIQFDLVMCSAALRTQETLEPLRSVIGTREVQISQSFYNASEDKILTQVQHIAERMNTVLYVGHNPGVAFAILKFAVVFPEFLLEGVKPATLVGFRFSVQAWGDVRWREGEIIETYQPPLSASEAPGPKES